MKRLGIVLFFFAIAAVTTILYHRLNSEWVAFRHAEAFFDEEQYLKAMPIYQDLLEKGFEAPRLFERLATCYLARSDGERASSILGQMIEGSEDRYAAMKRAGELYVSFGYFEKAADLYRTALQDRPEDRSVRIRLARVLSWSGRFDEAIDEYRKLLEGKNGKE